MFISSPPQSFSRFRPVCCCRLSWPKSFSCVHYPWLSSVGVLCHSRNKNCESFDFDFWHMVFDLNDSFHFIRHWFSPSLCLIWCCWPFCYDTNQSFSSVFWFSFLVFAFSCCSFRNRFHFRFRSSVFCSLIVIPNSPIPSFYGFVLIKSHRACTTSVTLNTPWRIVCLP